jgi:hypothetical protein
MEELIAKLKQLEVELEGKNAIIAHKDAIIDHNYAIIAQRGTRTLIFKKNTFQQAFILQIQYSYYCTVNLNFLFLFSSKHFC